MQEKTKVIVKTVLITLLGLGLLVGVFYAGYWYGRKTVSQKKTEKGLGKPVKITGQVSEGLETEIETSEVEGYQGWKTFVSQRFHYSLQYPGELELMSLGEGDNPFTDVIERGDEGIIIGEAIPESEGVRQTTIVNAQFLEQGESLSLKELVETKGSEFNICHEDKPDKLEEVVTLAGEKGYKVWYWVKKGCQGAEEKYINQPSVFFDARPRNNVLIEFYQGRGGEEFDKMVNSFRFIETIDYGD